MKYLIAFLFIASCSQSFATDKKYAVVRNGVIENVVVWDGISNWPPGAGFTRVDISGTQFVGIGFTCSKCDGSDFSAPINPVLPVDTDSQQQKQIDSLITDIKVLSTGTGVALPVAPDQMAAPAQLAQPAAGK